MPVILTTREQRWGGSQFQVSLGKKQDPILKIFNTK
jgi:hypothetical protein